MKCQILVRSGDLAGKVLYLDEGQRITIGRGSHADLVAPDSVMSRVHCAVALAGGRCEAEDLQSRNGVFVNGQRIAGRKTLASGDELRVGQTTFAVTVDIDAQQVLCEPAVEMPFEVLAPLEDLRSDPLGDAETRKAAAADPSVTARFPAAVVSPAGPATPAQPTTPTGASAAQVTLCLRCWRPITAREVQEGLARQEKDGWLCSSCVQPGTTEELGNYRLLDQLGKGSMSTVYRARHARLGKVVALKILDPALSGDQGIVVKFLREARAGGLVCHPNVVQILDAGEFRSRYFIGMEYVDGLPLHRHVAECGKLAAEETVRILTQVAHALEYTESRGMVHRDLKPGNILLDRSGAVKVKDFGKARWLEQSGMIALTHSTTGPGEMLFMSPEMVFDPASVDKRSDLYSLGALGVYCLSGQPPFAPQTAAKLIGVLRAQEPPFLAARPAEVPPGLFGVLHKCLRKDPKDRFQSAAEFLAALCPAPPVGGAGEGEASAAQDERQREAADQESAREEKGELQRAQSVQLKLIPASLPKLPPYDLAKYYQPAKAVGGDYFDFFRTANGQYALVVADVAGKGLAGAMVMVMVRSVFRALAAAGSSPAAALIQVNQGLHQDLQRGTFVSAILAYLDPKNDLLRFANAGHNPPLYCDARAGTARFIEDHGLALGITAGPRFVSGMKDVELHLGAQDLLAFYTDGVVEAMSPERTELGTDPMVTAVQEGRQEPAEGVVARIVRAIEGHRRYAEQSDDITLFVMKR